MKTIGRFDVVDFPLLGLSQVPVKIDTGAYTSTIHCSHILKKDEELYCTFKIGKEKVQVTFDSFKTKVVKSSNGQKEERYSIKSNIRLFNRLYKIDLTLSKRSDMRYPVLLGRKFLKKKFIVDVSQKNISLQNK